MRGSTRTGFDNLTFYLVNWSMRCRVLASLVAADFAHLSVTWKREEIQKKGDEVAQTNNDSYGTLKR